MKSEQTSLNQGIGFFIAAVIGGVVVLYAFGIAWLAINIGFTKAFFGSLGFVPGDLIKAVVAAPSVAPSWPAIRFYRSGAELGSGRKKRNRRTHHVRYL